MKAIGFCQVYELEEVFISAKKEKAQREIEYTTGTISRRMINSQIHGSLPSALSIMSSLHVKDYHGLAPTESVDMRGFYGGMTKHYVLLLDGVKMNDVETKLVDFSSLPLSCVEKVEVLKGASSFLFGENALAGAINILTGDAKKSLSLTLGTHDTRYITFSYPLFGTSFFMDAKTTDGYRRFTANRDIKMLLKKKIRGTTMLSHYRKLKREGYPWPLDEETLRRDRFAQRRRKEEDEGEKEEKGCMLLKDSLKIWGREKDGASFYIEGGSMIESVEEEKVFGASFKKRFFPKGIKMIMGTEVESSRFFEEKFLAPGKRRGRLLLSQLAGIKNVSFYSDAEVEKGKDVFSVGLRWDGAFFDYKKGEEKKEKKEDALSYKLSFIRRGKRNFYANLSTAFRTPTLGELFTFRAANIALSPERAFGIEVGIKGERTNLALYAMRLKDKILYCYRERIYKNIGKASYIGCEIDVEIPMGRELSTLLSYSFSCAKDEERGAFLPNVPMHRVAATFSYKGLQLCARYTSSFFIDEENKEKIDSAFVWDLAFSFFNERIKLLLKNLFDEPYSLYGFVMGGKRYLQPAPPLTLFMSVKIM